MFSFVVRVGRGGFFSQNGILVTKAAPAGDPPGTGSAIFCIGAGKLGGERRHEPVWFDPILRRELHRLAQHKQAAERTTTARRGMSFPRGRRRPSPRKGSDYHGWLCRRTAHAAIVERGDIRSGFCKAHSRVFVVWCDDCWANPITVWEQNEKGSAGALLFCRAPGFPLSFSALSILCCR